MESGKILKLISRLRTSDLLVAKMDCTKRISHYRALKHGLVALAGLFVSQIAKILYAGEVMDLLDFISVPMTGYSVLGYLVFNTLEASVNAEKGLIDDLLNLRMNRTGYSKKG